MTLKVEIEAVKVEIEAVKWGHFCELWHLWNTRKHMHGDAMIQIEKIFHKEFRTYRNQLKLIRKSVPWKAEKGDSASKKEAKK